MLYRIKLTTVEQVTIDRDKLCEAEEFRRQLLAECRDESHHGESTSAELQVLITLEGGDKIWATISEP